MKRFFIAVLFLVISFCKVDAQDIYYKNLNSGIIEQFKDTLQNLIFKNTDSTIDYSAYFKYVMKFYPNMRFQHIEIIFKPMQGVSKIRFNTKWFFQSPEKRRYKIYFSNSCQSTLDSIILKNLGTNSRTGLIANQMGYVEDLSTDGFFDLLAWRFKQLSKKKKNKLAYDNQLRIVETGLGYQMLSLSRDLEEKLKIENWKDAKAYARFVKHDKGKYMSPSTIVNFLQDMPVYTSHQYK